MSFGSSHDIKEQVREATDLVDLVSRSIRLRRQGKLYVGLCPWHDDSRPSLQVNPERQSWKCWVCDVGGDAFSFIMKREGVSFPEALRMLADRAGIAITARERAAEPGSPEDKQTLYRATAWAEQQFHRCLLDDQQAQPARDYLTQRGINDQSIQRFHVGFSPDSWQWLIDRAKTTPFSPAILEAAGLVSRSQDGGRFYDRFRGRLIFSIRDTQHRPIAFGARVLPSPDSESEGPKYINSPESRLFSKSNNLYALDIARDALSQDPRVVVVEGYTDVIMAHQHGVSNVVAALGTALGERHVRLLQRFSDEIVLVLDGDEAGQRRTNEILELFIAAQVNLRILTLPAGLDPCDFIQRHGAETFRQRVGEAVDALQHKLQIVTAGLDTVTETDRANRALEDLLRTMAKAPRVSSVTPESLRLREQQMLVRVARQFQADEQLLRARLTELRQGQGLLPSAVANGKKQPALTADEIELFQILLVHPELVDSALETVATEQLSSPLAGSLWQLYKLAHEKQIEFDFDHVMTVAEDAAIKNTLVQLYEDACSKAMVASEDAADRLNGIVRDFQFRRERSVQHQTLTALQQQGHDEKEEIEILQKIIENERNRQGISAPTDG